MSYSRARLLLGITCVGLWVVLSVIILGTSLSEPLFATDIQPVHVELYQVLLLVGFYIVIMLPFDILGGYTVPRAYGRNNQTGMAFLKNLLVSVLFHAFILCTFAFVVLFLWRQFGIAGAMAFYAVASCLLLLFQLTLLRFISGGIASRTEPRSSSENQVIRIFSQQQENVGGIFGVPGRERIVVPESLHARVGEEGIATVIARRIAILQSGARRNGVLIAWLFNAVGLFISLLLIDPENVGVSFIVQLSALMTCWNFIGLLLLPSLSRQGVFLGDRLAMQNGVPKETLIHTFRTLDTTQGDEPSRENWNQAIFHPTPSVQSRVDALEAGTVTFPAAWGTSRMMLYLSCASMGLLFRAVHSNVGLTEQWISVACD